MCNKYQSKYSPGILITGHQYIVELICERRAKYLDRDLPIKFWELEEWRSYFVVQSKYCYKLREKYSEEAIVKAIINSNIYTLSAKWFPSVIEKYQNIVDKKASQPKAVIEYKDDVTFKRVDDDKNIIDKLKDLE